MWYWRMTGISLVLAASCGGVDESSTQDSTRSDIDSQTDRQEELGASSSDSSEDIASAAQQITVFQCGPCLPWGKYCCYVDDWGNTSGCGNYSC